MATDDDLIRSRVPITPGSRVIESTYAPPPEHAPKTQGTTGSMQTNDPKGKGRATEATQSAQGSPTSGRPVPASPPLGSKGNPILFDYKPNNSKYSYDPNDPRDQTYGRHPPFDHFGDLDYLDG